jgi:DNA-binding HxlR family transcriptional regulator
MAKIETAARPRATSQAHCPVEATLDVIGGKWKVVILFWLKDRTLRFGELRRKIPGVSERVLTQQLRELEADGVVRREVFPQVPPRVEYSLTDYGRTLRPITELMCAWGKEHLRRNGRAFENGPDRGD